MKYHSKIFCWRNYYYYYYYYYYFIHQDCIKFIKNNSDNIYIVAKNINIYIYYTINDQYG